MVQLSTPAPGMAWGPSSQDGASHGEQDEEGDHQTEEPHGLGQRKAQNGIGEELLLERRVPARDKRSMPAPGQGRAEGPGDWGDWGVP